MTDAAGQTVAVACLAMGTRFEVVARGGCALDGRALANGVLRSAAEGAIDEVARWHGLLSAFERGSVVSRINAAEGKWVRCPGEVLSLLRLCVEMWHATGGAFDPTLGGLMRLAGFRGREREPGALADAAAWRGGCPIEVDVERGACRVLRPGGEIDLGAIGKGWALDRAVEVVREHGVLHALLHGGTSSVAGLGGPWRVQIGPGLAAEGGEGGGAYGQVVELRSCALGVSEGRGRVVGGYGHVLDPRTGDSAGLQGIDAWSAVTGASAAVCDALSTALLADRGGAWQLPAGYDRVCGCLNVCV